MEGGSNSDERTVAMLCHLSALIGLVIPFGHIIAPLVIWLMKKDTSPYIDYHGKESLNFQIAVTIYMVIASLSLLIFIGIVLLPLLGIAALVLVIIAGIKAKDGEEYRYPFIFRLL